MIAARPSEPRKPDPLTSREKQVLAEIANHLADDAGLAESMAREGWVPIRFGLPALLKPVMARALALTVLGLAVVFMPPVWWPVLALLLAMFGAPGLLLFLMSRDHRDPWPPVRGGEQDWR